MRSLPERGAPSHRQCPLFALHRPFCSLFRRNPLGRKEGRFRPKKGPYSLPFSGAGVGNSLSRRGGVSPSPIAPPSPTDTQGKTADARGQKKAVAGREKRHECSCLSVPLASVRVQAETGNAPPCLLFPRMVGRGNAADRPEKGCALPCPPGDSCTALLLWGVWPAHPSRLST